MLLAVRAPAADLEKNATWARSRVRLAPSSSPEWTWLDVGSLDHDAMERLAESASRDAPGLLLVVGEWRSALHLWMKAEKRASVAWTVGEANGLDADEAAAVAQEFRQALGTDPRTLLLLLRSASNPDQGWRSLTSAVGMPLPEHFPRLGSGTLDSDSARVLERRDLFNLILEDVGEGDLQSAPHHTPDPTWKFAGQILLLVLMCTGLGWLLTVGTVRVIHLVLLPLGILGTGASVIHQVALRRAARRTAMDSA